MRNLELQMKGCFGHAILNYSFCGCLCPHKRLSFVRTQTMVRENMNDCIILDFLPTPVAFFLKEIYEDIEF